ncbi:hypothetical protein Tco_1164764, partial [Tanacetum coccineum]
FTSYYKTVRVPKQEYNPILDIPTKNVEEGKEYTCLTSHQCDFAEIKAPNMEAANRKGKEKIEHFGVKLEDLNDKEDHDSPTTSTYTIKQGKRTNSEQGIKIKTEDNEDNISTSSKDFVIIV